MRVDGRPLRPIRPFSGRDGVEVIDQRALPHELRLCTLCTADEVFVAIRDMWVRGAPLIGAAGAFGVALALRDDGSDDGLDRAAAHLRAARPTAVNLAWAIDRVVRRARPLPVDRRAESAWCEAEAIADEDVTVNESLGRHGLALLTDLAKRHPDRPVRVLTHCNAGWLATVDWGTATSPLYHAQALGLPLHVWVDETRPRNQGASLTAWELGHAGVPHTVIADNAGGHLMQQGLVDIVFVGCDRVAANGDVCNKIGTYLKALAARDNGVPFYVAMPTSTLDLALPHGRAIPIEERHAREVTHVVGRDEAGRRVEVQLTPEGSQAANPAFDITPAHLVTGLLTERGIVAADEAALRRWMEPSR
jgi:methylthioribose-1-phosphate isomerase